jgi:predicted dienelactone hydrolase
MKRLMFGVASWILRRTIDNSQNTHRSRPDAPPYGQRGPFGVGTHEVTIPHRTRPLKLAMWYPACLGDQPALTTYEDGPIKFYGQALRDAPPDPHQAPYPLVLFSHGSSGTRYQSLFLTEHLASHGFVVMAVDHPGNTAFDAYLSSDRYEELRIQNYVQRPDDLLRQLAFAEELSAPTGAWPGLIDLERVAVSGHSFGGYSALALAGARLNFDSLRQWCETPSTAAIEAKAMGSVCYLRHHVEVFAELRGLETIPEGLWPPTSDPRIKALLVMAPWNAPIFGQAGLAEVTIPSLVMVGGADRVTLPERDALRIYDYLGSPSKTLAVFENGGHFLFVDECSALTRQLNLFWTCSDDVWDMTRAHDLTNHLATAFLLSKLYQDAHAAQALQPRAVDFRGIQYKTTDFN